VTRAAAPDTSGRGGLRVSSMPSPYAIAETLCKEILQNFSA
jgi:hypothetical protein